MSTFSWQQELSDKMICHNSKQIMNKYDVENRMALEHQIAGRELEIERKKMKTEASQVLIGKNHHRDRSNIGGAEFEDITRMSSKIDTCRMFGFPNAKWKRDSC